LCYYRGRVYHAGLGRFLSRDPDPVSSGYAYVAGNPVSYGDPLGAHRVYIRHRNQISGDEPIVGHTYVGFGLGHLGQFDRVTPTDMAYALGLWPWPSLIPGLTYNVGEVREETNASLLTQDGDPPQMQRAAFSNSYGEWAYQEFYYATLEAIGTYQQRALPSKLSKDPPRDYGQHYWNAGNPHFDCDDWANKVVDIGYVRAGVEIIAAEVAAAQGRLQMEMARAGNTWEPEDWGARSGPGPIAQRMGMVPLFASEAGAVADRAKPWDVQVSFPGTLNSVGTWDLEMVIAGKKVTLQEWLETHPWMGDPDLHGQHMAAEYWYQAFPTRWWDK
jgi:hypothetical protein